MRSISQCLNKQLADICQRSVQLEELSNKVRRMLPETLANTCHVGSFNKGCLLLTTTDAAWASQLRYMIPELRDKLRKEGGMYQLTSIKIVVTEPTVRYEKSAATSKHVLSEKAKEIIISESQQCNYEPLQKALLRLADGDD
ncbi:DUF721 domain-containing protein [Fluoribacter dumoffii]|uniref:Zn-ribbon-containing, possibly RNA-binding protein and truncated derivatives n=1 Tax=Fluoribacter dumoffii TaxID=463 RepID=A0A377GE15_9GAMM|nr:DUF721 domain-containing protein [Fluoribacter dumoffii]KTC90995.1 hypothetical protein Ldum_2063 [Fluoribacter dumoffii NY 23]MCW8386564.1 DUF721 domain-containing protein [Fluoribacter dumoffii]MCW8498163.1 DUF721 domain-containing protein [Fluoribacter dumoffii]STO22568.1 Zn-ribbon-containing, possibly RNA-binding protein and truncated derivatives [Fluoribacter dumoffii]